MDEETTRLFRIRRTVMQMLNDRGYLIGDYDLNMNRSQFIDKYGENVKREDLVINKTKRDSSDQVISIPFSIFWFSLSNFPLSRPLIWRHPPWMGRGWKIVAFEWLERLIRAGFFFCLLTVDRWSGCTDWFLPFYWYGFHLLWYELFEKTSSYGAQNEYSSKRKIG